MRTLEQLKADEKRLAESLEKVREAISNYNAYQAIEQAIEKVGFDPAWDRPEVIDPSTVRVRLPNCNNDYMKAQLSFAIRFIDAYDDTWIEWDRWYTEIGEFDLPDRYLVITIGRNFAPKEG